MTFRRGSPSATDKRLISWACPASTFECKRVERINVPEVMEQAKQDADFFRDGAPTVFHRRNRSPWLVTMRLEDWLKLYGKTKH